MWSTMLSKFLIFLLSCSLLVCAQDFVAPAPLLQNVCPRGFRIWIPDSDGFSFVAFHMSVNKLLHGAAQSEYNVDLVRKSGGHWQHDIPDLHLKEGDKVYYWMHIVYKGISYLSTDHTWVIPGTSCYGQNNTDLHCQTSQTIFQGNKVCSGQLIFEDDFTYLNFDRWSHEITASGGKHSEFQMYVNNRQNSFVQDGVLHIHPTLTEEEYGVSFVYSGILDFRGSTTAGDQCTDSSNNGCYKRAVGPQILNPVMSASLNTAKSFSFQYGVLKIRARMPSGDWLWPKIILMPLHNAYGNWPKSGQIILAESRGNILSEKTLLGEQRLEFGLLYGWNESDITVIRNHKLAKEDTRWDQVFHIYEMEWTQEQIVYKVDGEEILRMVAPEGLPDAISKTTSNIYSHGTKMAPFDKPFYISISTAVGGISDFFPDAQNNLYSKPWNNTSPYAMLDFWSKKSEWLPTWKGGNTDFQVDYIRVWALP